MTTRSNWSIDRLPRMVALVAALATSMVGGRASAGPTDEEARFKLHYEQGLALYSSEEYDGAIKEFQAAYAVRAKPRLLFNLGQAHRHLGNAKEALRFFLLYQAMEPNPKPGLKAELEGYIAQMRTITEQAEAARRAEEQLPAPAAPPPVVVAPSPSPPPSAPTAIVESPDTPSIAREPLRPQPLYKRPWLWLVVGAAVTVLAFSIGLGVALGSGRSYGGDIRSISF